MYAVQYRQAGVAAGMTGSDGSNGNLEIPQCLHVVLHFAERKGLDSLRVAIASPCYELS